MRRWQWLPLVAALAIILAACAPSAQAPAEKPSAEKPAAEQPKGTQPKYGGILRKVLGADPPTADSQQSNTYATNEPFHPVFNGLVRYDPYDPQHSKIEPDLAEKWEVSKDGLTYTFYIRKDVKFHDGGTFNARDAQFNIDRMKNPPKGMVSPRRNAFANVEKVEAVDDYTLKLTMNRPFASFMANLSLGWMVMHDKEWLEAGHDANQEVNGTGPFMLKKYTRGTSIELVKNPNYWKKGFPYLDGVTLFIVPDGGTALAAFRTGQLDDHRDVNAADVEGLKKELGDKITITDTYGWGGTFVNLSVKNKTLEDVRVRQALSLAVNREEAIKVISSGQAYVQGYMPGKGNWTLPAAELAKLPGYGPDMEIRRTEAKKLLADAGFGSGLSMKLGVRKVPNAEDAAIYVKDAWSKIGVNVTLDIQETATAYTNMEQGTYDLFIWGTAYALDDPDAVYSEHYTCDAPRNYSRICNKEVDALYTKQSVATDPEERKKLVWEMEKLAVKDVIKLIVQGSQSRWVMYKYVKDFVPQATRYSNSHMEGVWMDK
ncbi:MAG TPA: ABC transporter substrate-binding protein [Dehalococcoidia bacterium]|nr:ABC transporter substrate-binding protein [Dehalococcoidia bacterium]